MATIGGEKPFADPQEAGEACRVTFDVAAIGIGHVDPDGHFLRVNRKFCEISGYTAAELKSLTFDDITHPADREKNRQLFRRLIAGEINDYYFEKRNIRKDGSIIWVRLAFSMVRNQKGQPLFGVGFIEDISDRKAVEDALRFSEARFEALFRDNPVMIVTLDADLVMLSVNPTCARQLGYTIEELEGQSVLMLFCGDDRAAVAEQLRQCLQSPNQIYSWQFRKMCKNQEMVWVEEIAQAVYDLNGKLNILVVCQDVTERKRADDALRESEAFKQGILDSLPAHIAVLDKEGIVIAVNRSWIRFAEDNGLSDPASVSKGANYLAVVRQAAKIDYPGAQQALEGIEAILSGKSDSFTVEYPCDSPDQERWFLMHVVRPDYTFHGAVIIHQDITEQKHAEEKIRLSERNYRTIFDAANDAMYIHDPETGRILDVNEKMLNLVKISKEEAVQMTVMELSGDPNATEDRILQLIQDATETPHVFEWLGKDRTGRVFWVEVSLKRVQLQGADRVIAVVRDISARKEAEEKLQHAMTQLKRINHELKQFAYVASHDLQEPLRMITSYMSLLERKYQPQLDETATTYIHFAVDGAKRMQALIEGLLKYSSIRTPALTLVDTAAICANARANLSAAIADSGAEFSVSALPMVRGDAIMLLQLFQNLMSNAIKYQKPGVAPLITVTAVKEDHAWLFSISDNGIGIPAEHYEDIFEIFRRLHTSEEYPGTGIGLASCKKIVEQHGGRIWLESSPGVGTTFFFTLPSVEGD